jgi:hypothetical protein
VADASAAAHTNAATAVAPAHQVAELTLHLGPRGPVARLPGRGALSFPGAP